MLAGPLNREDTSVRRESAAADKIQKAHRTIMIANHPDTGGSPLIAMKVNEAKEVLTGKKKATGSPFS